MEIVDKIVEAIVALFILFIFATLVLPEIGKATGQNTFWLTLSLFLIGVGIVVSVLTYLFRD